MRRIHWMFATVFIGLCLGGCDETDLIRNPYVDRWCGERPCGWEAEGKIERVGTWHPSDYAVELVSDHARLHQLNATVDEGVRCYEFAMIAKIDDTARVFVELDFLADGTAEFSQRLRPTDYAPLRFLISAPIWYRGVRFSVRKDGPGKAVLAKMRALESDECTKAPILLSDLPLGARCQEAEQCLDGSCVDGVCSSCRDELACEATASCGYVPTEFGDARACVDDGSVRFGLPCTGDVQCESGVCCAGTCAECCVDEDCEAGAVCDYSMTDNPAGRDALEGWAWPWPKLCDPDGGERQEGELCLSSADCASVSCTGVEHVCTEETCDPEDDWCFAYCRKQRAVPGVCD